MKIFTFFTLFLLFSNTILSQPTYLNKKYPRLYTKNISKLQLSIKNDRIWKEMFLPMYENFFEKLLIKTILYEHDWHLILQYFIYLINNENKHRDIHMIFDLSQLISNNIDQSFIISHSNETLNLSEFFQLLLLFLNQILNTKLYTPSLSSENFLDNMNYLIQKILRQFLEK